MVVAAVGVVLEVLGEQLVRLRVMVATRAAADTLAPIVTIPPSPPFQPLAVTVFGQLLRKKWF
jgi:hypothetical protein